MEATIGSTVAKNYTDSALCNKYGVFFLFLYTGPMDFFDVKRFKRQKKKRKTQKVNVKNMNFLRYIPRYFLVHGKL